MEKELQDYIREFIQKRYVMVLGVASNNEPSVSAVWYVTEDAKILYFKSRTASTHSKILEQNPKAAICIYDHQSTYLRKSGVQAVGVVERVKSLEEMGKVTMLYGKAFQGAGEKLTSLTELVGDYVKSTMYKITISHIKMVDTSKDILIEEYEAWV